MARTGTVHVAESVDALTLAMARIATWQVPERPFLVAGQYARMDPTRQPAGAETFWGYTHVPREVRGDAGGTASRAAGTSASARRSPTAWRPSSSAWRPASASG